ncbi:MAG: flagellar brake protein [Pseudomonadota bacterium]
MPLQPLRKDELILGQPAPYSVFDADRVLLLARGCVIASQNVLDTLREQGMFSSEEKPSGANLGRLYRPSVAQVLDGESAPRRGTAPGALPIAQSGGGDAVQTVMPFIETAMRIGDTLQMRFDDGSPERYAVRLIGAVDRKSVLVTHPQNEGRMMFIKDGQTLGFTGMRGKHAYAFDAPVLRCQLSPFPYMHLAYPQQVRTTTIRKAHRVELNGVASIGRADGKGRLACNLRDLSVGGALLTVPKPLADYGTEVSIAFRLNIDDAPVTIEVQGIVRSVRPAEEPGASFRPCGVEFINVPTDLRRMLQLFVYESLLAEH